MSSVCKPSSAAFSPRLAALLLGGVLVCGQALAAVEVSPMSPSSSDNLTVTHYEGNDVHSLRSSGYAVSDLKKMHDTLEKLERSNSEQAREIEALKRSSSSSSSSSSSEVSDLKRTLKAQDNDISSLRKQVEELKRSAGSSSSSSSSELSNLKREVSNQDRELQSLKRTLDELSRKVK